MKTAVIYYSNHHGNTKKVLDAIAKKFDVTLIDVAAAADIDLKRYDLIGFASGIYYSKFHRSLLSFAEQHLPEEKKVFFIYTYGAKKDGYTKAIKTVVSRKRSEVVGEFGCFGFNTYGPFKLIGGIAKGHPDSGDLEAAVHFYDGLME